MYLVDTNILLRYPSVLNEYKGEITIPIRVIEELDGLKRSHNSEIAYQARRASHKIMLCFDDLHFIMDRDDKLSVDDDIIKIAKKKDFTVISNDLNVDLKCGAQKVKWTQYDKVETSYTGVQYMDLDLDDNLYNRQLEDMLETGRPPFLMRENEFLIVKNAENGEVLNTFIQKEGKLEVVHNNYFKNDFCGKIAPRNVEQNCLMSLLRNSAISILAAIGDYGTGKSFLLTNYAIKELERGAIDKIVYIPNNSIVEDTRDLGTLPGDMTDKELSYMGPVLDIIGEIYARKMIEEGTLEIVPIAVARGRSFAHSIIIVNEAQNLTTEHIKLLVARCGEGTRIFFDGDIKQADSSVFKNKSGLKLLLHLSNSEDYASIFGAVKLNTIERSKTAQASAYLDNLLI